MTDKAVTGLPELQAGIKTSEASLTGILSVLVPIFVSILVYFGKPQTEAVQMAEIIGSGVVAVITAVSYIWSRVKAKEYHTNAVADVIQMQLRKQIAEAQNVTVNNIVEPPHKLEGGLL